MDQRLTTCHNREIAKIAIARTKNPYFIDRGIARKGSNHARSVEVGGELHLDAAGRAALDARHDLGKRQLGRDRQEHMDRLCQVGDAQTQLGGNVAIQAANSAA